MGLPSNLTTITVTGQNVVAPDGTALNGSFLFQPSSQLFDSAAPGVVDVQGLGEVTNGVMASIVIPTTDTLNVSPTPFTYTVTSVLTYPDGTTVTRVYPGVLIPSSLGSTVDVGQLNYNQNEIVTLPVTARSWLYVSGTHVYEGSGGPRYRGTGYNSVFSHPAEPNAMSTTQFDTFLSRLRPNSLVRLWAFAPASGTGISWSTAQTAIQAQVAAIQAYGHRAILVLGLWVGGTLEAYGTKTSSWITGQQYLHSIFGANSYQDWVTALIELFENNPTVAMYDIMNEPTDSGGTNTTAYATFVSTVTGWINGVIPNALVYTGISDPSAVGGTTKYATIIASQHVASSHEFGTTGVPVADDAAGSATAGKPVLIDAFGFWAKGQYGALADTDKDPNGLPAMSWVAQSDMTAEYLADALGNDQVFGALLYSYEDKSQTTGGYTGLGAYEPINTAPAHEQVRNCYLDRTSVGRLALPPNVGSWISSIQSLRYKDTTQVSTATSALYYIQDGVGRTQYTQATAAIAPVARHGAVSDGNAIPRNTFQFSGTQYITAPNTGIPTTSSWYFLVVPTALPTSGAYCYLIAPSTNVTALGIRITSAGVVQLVQYSGATGTNIIATGTIPVNLGAVNLISVQVASATSYRLDVNTVTDVSGTTSTTLVSSSTAHLGAAHDGTNGFQGHLLELVEDGAITNAQSLSTLYAYLTSKYGIIPTSGSGGTSLTVSTLTATSVVATHLQGGSLAMQLVSTATAYSLSSTDGLLLCNATSAAFNVTLPTASSVPKGTVYAIKKTDSSSHAVTVATSGGATLDGASTFPLSFQNQSVIVTTDNTNWFTMSNDPPIYSSAPLADTYTAIAGATGQPSDGGHAHSYIGPTGGQIALKSANYTATTTDSAILGNATSAAFTVTLPTAVGVAGQTYFIKKTDSSGNAVTVGTTSSQTIDGVTTYVLGAQYQSVSVVSDGSNWQAIAQAGPVDISLSDISSNTVTGTTATNITTAWSVPANALVVGSIVEIEAFGTGTQASTTHQLTINALVGSNTSVTNTMANTFVPASTSFSWKARLVVQITSTTTANVMLEGLFEQNGGLPTQGGPAVGPSDTAPFHRFSSGITVALNSALALSIQMAWGATGSSITGSGSIQTRKCLAS